MGTSRPILLSALLKSSIQEGIPNKAIVGYYDGSGTNPELPSGTVFIASGLKLDDVKQLIDNNDGIINHIRDTSIHWSAAQHREDEKKTQLLYSHTGDLTIHVSIDDRKNWDGKETEAGAQAKANAVQANLEVHEADLDIHTTKLERDRWNNTYTREEVANMVSTAHSNSMWKDAVDTFDDLAIVYPDPKKGWICSVKDTMITYSYDGERWVTAFINTMPLATKEINGLMSKEQYIKLSNIEDLANYYVHPDNINCRHVTDLQIKKWDNKADKKLATIFEAGLMSTMDKEKIDTVERYSNYYVHPEFHSADMIEETELRKFVTQQQIDTWSNPSGVLASETQDGAMSKDLYIKLMEIEDKANKYVHPAKHSSTDIAQDVLHRFVTDEQIKAWDRKEDTISVIARVANALQEAKDYANTVKSEIIGGAGEAFDTLKELADALGNDGNLSATITAELSNKVDIQKFEDHVASEVHLTTDERLKLDSVDFNANYYIHPDYHPAEMIKTSPAYRLVSDIQIAYWDGKAPGTVATPTQDGIMSKEYAAKLEAISTTGKVRSDWNQNDSTADSYIYNKPTKLPADGGNADTIEGYTVAQLRNAGKPFTVVLGAASSGYTDKQVDLVCDGTNDCQQIQNALDMIGPSGGHIVFKEGTYVISSTVNIDKVNLYLEGRGVTLKNNLPSNTDIMVHLSGINCTLEGFIFDGVSKASPTLYCLYIDGNINTVRNCKFKNGGTGIRIVNGNSNKVVDNDFNMVIRAVLVEAGENKNCYGTIIRGNSVIDCTREGIVLMSPLVGKVTNTVITDNTILNAYTGIRLTNQHMSYNTINTVITGNNIMRGSGLTSDYLYEQRTVYIEYADFAVVTGNMLRGRDVFDKTTDSHNLIANNLSI